MKSTIIRLAVVTVTALVAAVAAGTAAASPDSHLLRTYQPVTVFDPTESFRPTNVQSFIGDADLERRDGPSWTVVDADPELDELPGPGTGIWRLNQDSCSPAAALGGLACYADAAAHKSDDGGVVYGRVVRLADAVVLQYWFFYYDDVYSYLHPPADFIWQAHEGDWEVVNVILSPDEEPTSVAYSQHCLGQRRAWETTPREDTHPIVYVAAGSHANYLSPGVHPFDVRCIPPAAIGILGQAGLPLPVDFTGNGDVAGPKSLDVERTKLKQLHEDEDEGWLAFPGFWGELQYFHSPWTGTVAFGTAPVGPAYHAVWNDPLGTIATWPVG